MSQKTILIISRVSQALALHAGCEFAVKRFLESGAAVDSIDGSGRTTLMSVIANGHCAVVRLLLDSSSDVGHWNYSCEMALHLAVVNEHPHIVKLLMDADLVANI